MVNHDLDPIYGTALYMTSPTDTYSLARTGARSRTRASRRL